MKIFLVIQRTTNGLMTNFKSPDLPLSENDIENLFMDEQNAAQLAKSSVIYTVENQNKFRVYSYIDSNVSDTAGRAGYYAIRLLIPVDKILVNLYSIFESISQNYKHFFVQKNLGAQDYSLLLDAIIKQNCLLDKSVFVGSKKEGKFFSKYTDEKFIDVPLNEDNTYLIKKLYLFAKDQSKGDEVIRQSGFKSFAALSDSIKNIKVINTEKYLQILKINDKEISFPKGNFELFVFDSDRITFRDKNRDNKKEKEHRGETLEVRRPIPVNVPPVDPDISKNQKKGFGLGPLLASSFGTLIIGGLLGGVLSYYFWFSKEINKKEVEIADLQQRKPLYFTLDGVAGDLIFDGKNIDDLINYRFKYNSKSQRWEYDEGRQTYRNLDSAGLQDIVSGKNFDESTFINALEKISGKTIDFSKVKETSGIPSPTESSPPKVAIIETPVVESPTEGIKSPATPPVKINSPSNNNSGTTTKEKTASEIAKEKKKQADNTKAEAAKENITKSGQNPAKPKKADAGPAVKIE